MNKAVFVVMVLLFSGRLVSAQEGQKAPKPVKIGYTNVNYILRLSPESKVITSQLESTQKQYLKTIEEKKKELEAKQEAYQKNASTMLESIRKDKEDELRNLYNSILNLQETAQEELKKKEEDLVKPELDKIYKAINEVAADYAFTHVFNSDQVLLYADEDSDITTLVMNKLGYKEPSETEAPKTTAPPAQKPATTPQPAKKPAPKK
jgi:outer membrane protein